MNYFESGVTKARKGDYEGAIADFKVGIELEPHDERLYLAKGICIAKLQGNRRNLVEHAQDTRFKNKQG